MFQILLSEGHPEAGTTDGRIVDDQRLYLLMVEQVAVAWADVRIGKVFMNLQRLGLHPFAVFPIEALLGDLADVDLGVEVGGEGLVVVAGVAVDDVEILYFLEVMLGGIGRIDRGDTRIETTAEDGCQASLLEAFTVGPLPGVLEMGLILGLVVGSIEIAASAGQTSLHDGEVLIRQGEVDDQLGLEVVEQSLELLHVVGIDLSRLDIK